MGTRHAAGSPVRRSHDLDKKKGWFLFLIELF